MADFGSVDIVIHSLNIAALGGGLVALLKVVVPASLSIRDSLRDTASMLSALQDKTKDHEERLRMVERYSGPERRSLPREGV